MGRQVGKELLTSASLNVMPGMLVVGRKLPPAAAAGVWDEEEDACVLRKASISACEMPFALASSTDAYWALLPAPMFGTARVCPSFSSKLGNGKEAARFRSITITIYAKKYIHDICRESRAISMV
jgi:hypothetical protein